MELFSENILNIKITYLPQASACSRVSGMGWLSVSGTRNIVPPAMAAQMPNITDGIGAQTAI